MYISRLHGVELNLFFSMKVFTNLWLMKDDVSGKSIFTFNSFTLFHMPIHISHLDEVKFWFTNVKCRLKKKDWESNYSGIVSNYRAR